MKSPSSTSGSKLWDWSRQAQRPALDASSLRAAALSECNAAARLFSGPGLDGCGDGTQGFLDRSALPMELCTREAYRLTGRYFPGAMARDMIRRIQEHKWLTAEKVGRDVWTETDPTLGWEKASQDWLARHLEAWEAHWAVRAKGNRAC